MRSKTQKIILDRLATALDAQKVRLKRGQLLEVAANAFGYRSSNAFVAAAKEGDLDPPEGIYIGTVSNGPDDVIILRDPAADAPYGIARSFVEQVVSQEAADQIGVTPYGNMIDIRSLMEQSKKTTNMKMGPEQDIFPEKTTIVIHTATVDHKNGTTCYYSDSEDKIDQKLANYCRENWDERANLDLPDNPDAVGNSDEIIEAYFHGHGDQFYNRTSEEITINLNKYIVSGDANKNMQESHKTSTPLPAAESETGHNQHVVSRYSEQENEMLYWSNDTGWGDLNSATVYPDTDYDLPYVGDGSQPKWTRLPRYEQAPVTLDPMLDMTGEIYSNMDMQIEIVQHTEGPNGQSIVARVKVNQEMDPVSNDMLDQIKKIGILYTDMDNGDVLYEIGSNVINNAQSDHTLLQLLRYIQMNGETVEAQFIPQTWIDDNAVNVDINDDNSYNVAFDLILAGSNRLDEALDDIDHDYLRKALMAPKWVKEWHGPFEVYLEPNESGFLEENIEKKIGAYLVD